jgi:hypothetical protein
MARRDDRFSFDRAKEAKERAERKAKQRRGGKS